MQLTKNTKIAVLLGGFSDEREVSLETGEKMAQSLIEKEYKNVTKIDVGRDVDQKLRQLQPDVVLNALHGTWGEDGCIQGMLEMMDIPYTGSGVTASAVGMNKILSHMLMRQLGISLAESYVWSVSESESSRLGYPVVIKDPENGSSRGVYIIKDEHQWKQVVQDLDEGATVLVEKYFKGREINVAVINNQVMGDVEVIPANDFYDFESKYLSDDTQYIVNPDYSENVRKKLHDAAFTMHTTIGCSGATRSDFIVDGEKYIMLEINSLPGMTAHSLVPMIAKAKGISYVEVVEMLLEDALNRGGKTGRKT